MRISRIIPAAALLIGLGLFSAAFGGELGVYRSCLPGRAALELSATLGADILPGAFAGYPMPVLDGALRAGMPDAALSWGPAPVRRPVYILPFDDSPGCAAQARARELECASPGSSRVAPDVLSSLRKIFSSRGLPAALVWIAEVESAFDPHAVSSAGAVGLFQLMPATAERFGLRVWPLDERKRPEKSAEAAADYLRFLRDEFGSWPLALAAYNAGEGRVIRAMRSSNARTFEELAPHLALETRRYVPRVMTVMALREDQARGVPAAFFMP